MSRDSTDAQGKRLGQILAASTRSFTAQAQELHRPPPLGALVRAEGPTLSSSAGVANPGIYAVVMGSKTESVEGRLPVATGWELRDGAAVLREEPHLSKLLATTFEAAVVAHDAGEGMRVGLAPRPAPLYGFVQECPPEADVAQALAASLDFLPLLLSAAPDLAEEAAAACLRLLAEGQRDPEAFLLRAGKRLAVLLARDPARLESALRRLAK
ncbi:MAG: hypothetical protein EXR60_04425 [Dehalococcoidia bacterium]|nr:hypothetical protein [Dehalococcoidia bacterium]